jgi:D-galactarolactone cycloisomerase
MPKIKSIELKSFEYVMEPSKAYGMARGLNFRRSCSLVELTTDDGVVGHGEAGGPPHIMRETLKMARPFFLDRSVYDFELNAAHIYNRLYHFGVQSQLTPLLSGISIASLDAVGKSANMAVHDLLGGKATDRFGCYATTGYFTPDSENTFATQLQQVVSAGFSAAKIKIGGGPASDLERVRLAREILGDAVLLMVDINGNYTVDIALQTLRLIEPYGIHWCEEPLPPTDVAGYAELHKRSPIALAAGEAFYTVHDFKRLVDARGLDILMPSMITCGGFGQAKAIATLALMNNLRVSPSVWANGLALAASLHFAASLPVSPHTDHVPFPLLIEYDTGVNPFRDGMLTEPLRMTDGEIAVPTGPGLGVTVDTRAVEQFALR